MSLHFLPVQGEEYACLTFRLVLLMRQLTVIVPTLKLNLRREDEFLFLNSFLSLP